MEAMIFDIFLKYILFPIFAIVVSAVFLFFAFKNKLLEKKCIVYLTSSVLGISMLGILGLMNVYFMPYAFIVIQSIVLLFGMLNYYLLLRWLAPLRSSLGKFVQLLIPQIVLSWALFSVAFNLTNSFQYGVYAGGLVLSLSVAPLLMYAYNAYLQIPIEVYKLREFQCSDNFSVPYQTLGTEDILVCEVELFRQQGDKESIRIKAKAKSNMIVGDWFGLIVSDYNSQAGCRQIELNDSQGKYGWTFYVTPSFFRTRRYIDPDATFVDNGLVEKDLIVAMRVQKQD